MARQVIDFGVTQIEFETFLAMCKIWNSIEAIGDREEQARQAITEDLKYGNYNVHGHREGFRIAKALVSDDSLKRILTAELQVHSSVRWPTSKHNMHQPAQCSGHRK